MSNKRDPDYSPSKGRCYKKLARSEVRVEGSTDASSGSAHMRSPASFAKILNSNLQLWHTSKISACRLELPKAFCCKHNVTRNLIMTNSTEHTLWHMRCESSKLEKGRYIISNGWREFSYDHSLKLNDKLVFTLMSPSHFVVAFATRAMRPTREGKKYPWRRIKRFNAWRSYSENVQGVAMATAGLRPKASKQSLEREGLCQCYTEEIENRHCTWKSFTTKPLHLPELTYLECKNSDGTSFLQILDSEDDSDCTTTQSRRFQLECCRVTKLHLV